MRRLNTPPWVLGSVVVAGAWIAKHPGTASAGPAAPGVVETVFQPDGTPIRIALWGDEFANGWETVGGYTVLKNPADLYWTHAMLDANGGLKPSAQRVGRDAPTGPAHLRPTDAAIDSARPLSAVTSTVRPSSSSGGTSSPWRDRSNPAYNMHGPPRCGLRWRPNVAATETLLQDIQGGVP